MIRRRSVLENHLRHRLLGGVRDRQSHIFHTELCGEFSGFTVERHSRTASGHSRHFAIPPAYSVIPSCSQSFHRSFLGGEARRIALEAICLGIAIAHLARGEDALQETLPEALEGP